MCNWEKLRELESLFNQSQQETSKNEVKNHCYFQEYLVCVISFKK